MNDWTVYYNPHCGTCRKVRERLEAKGIKPRFVEYLKTPPTTDELDAVLKKIGAGPEAITRMQEPVIEEKDLRFDGLPRKDWLELIVKNPVLLQRPIVVHGEKAVVGRPPESVDVLFDK
jgi:arsenate reductase (glutaredoxin)